MSCRSISTALGSLPYTGTSGACRSASAPRASTFSTNGLDKEEAYVFHLIDNDPDLQKITERYPGLKIVDYGQIVIDEVTLLDDGFIDPIGSSPDLNKHSLNELKELIGEEYDRQNDKGFFEEEQVGLSDLMGTLRDAAEHKHDTRDNTHSHDIDAR